MNAKFAEWSIASLISHINVIEGSIRVGKDYIATRMFIERIRAFKGEAIMFMIAAVNIKQSYRIVGQYILDYCGTSAQRSLYGGSPAITLKVGYKTYYIVFAGGSKNGSDVDIQGSTFGGVYFTEINKLKPEFITQAMERMGTDGELAFIYATLNPVSANNFFYTDYLNQWEKENELTPNYLNYMHVTLEDSPFLTKEKIEFLKKGKDPDSYTYKRDILGERVDPEGSIYRIREYNIIDSWEPREYIDYIVVCDPGVSKSASAFVMLGLTYDSSKSQYCVDVLKTYSYINNANPNDIHMYAETATDYANFILECGKIMNRYPEVYYIDMDVEFYRNCIIAFNKTPLGSSDIKYVIKDTIEERIKRETNLLYSGKLRFYKNCTEAIEEYKNAQYDVAALAKGKLAMLSNFNDSGHSDILAAISYAITYYKDSLYS